MFTLLVALTVAAPAPLPKPEYKLKSSDLVGKWKLTIDAGEGKMTGFLDFHNNGTYDQGFRTTEGADIGARGEWEYNKEKTLPLVLIMSESYRKDFSTDYDADTTVWHYKFSKGTRNKLVFQVTIAYCPLKSAEVTLERLK